MQEDIVVSKSDGREEIICEWSKSWQSALIYIWFTLVREKIIEKSSFFFAVHPKLVIDF